MEGAELECPRCRETTELIGKGRTELGAIPIHCEACGHWWLRWPAQPCRSCGSSTVSVGEQHWEYYDDPEDAGPRSEQQPLQAIERTFRCADCNRVWTDHLPLRHGPEVGMGWTEEALWLLSEQSLRERAGYWGLVARDTPRDVLVAELLAFQYLPWTRELLERAALDAVLAEAEDYGIAITGRDRSQLISAILKVQETE